MAEAIRAETKTRVARLGYVPLLWYALFLFGPLALVIATSLATRGTYGGIDWTISFESFRRALDPLYATVLWRSFWLSTLTSVLCLLIGFPIALAIATASRASRSILIMALAVPFLTNLVIRVCALRSLTAVGGPLDIFLSVLNVEHDPFALSQNMPLVMIGMVTTYLPFMIFPIYGALERFDFSLVEAAQDLGARDFQVFARVLVPAMRAPIVAGTLLVFIPALGEFVIPDLLGGAKTMLTGNLISEQFLKARDWPFGSALSVLLLLVLLISIAFIRRFGEGRRPRHA